MCTNGKCGFGFLVKDGAEAYLVIGALSPLLSSPLSFHWLARRIQEKLVQMWPLLTEHAIPADSSAGAFSSI
jgi:hypothetical protein